ncbi:MAG: hypothetical protein ABG776_15570 [Cyanobacteria bacterium J06555_13]
METGTVRPRSLYDIGREKCVKLEIWIAHYPPYTSKYNPIEHHLFPHPSRVCQGVIFDFVEMVRDLMATASTKAGLQVFTTIIDAVYETVRKASDEFKTNMPISL